MAKKKSTFKIGAIVRPDAKPEDVSNIGAVGNVIRNPINEQRAAELQQLMTKEVPIPSTKEKVNNEKYEILFPASYEELIPRNKLVPAPNEWNFFGRPSADQYALIFQSIYKYGLWHPITAWEQEDGTYMILGGHTRDLVYDELYQMTNDEKYLSIPCKIYKHDQISECTARRIIILTNIAQRAQENPGIRIRCYCEMAKLEKMETFYGSGIDVNEAVAKLFGVSRSTVSFYRKLENLIDPFVDMLSNREISRRAATILSDLPESLQKYILTKEYHLSFTSHRLHKMKKIVSAAELDLLFSQEDPAKKERFQYVFSSPIEKPANYETVPIYVNQDEIDEFKTLLKTALQSSDKISDKTKTLIRSMLH